MSTDVILVDQKHLNKILNYKPKKASLYARLADYLEALQQPNPAKKLEEMVKQDFHKQPREFTDMAWGLYLDLSVAEGECYFNNHELSPIAKIKIKEYSKSFPK